MALFEAGGLIFNEESRLIHPGEQFRSDRVPGKNWLPLDDEAVKAVEERFGRNGPTISSLERQPSPTAGPVAIPEDWRGLHHLRLIQIAKQIRPSLEATDDKTISQVATEVISAELARRSAVNATESPDGRLAV